MTISDDLFNLWAERRMGILGDITDNIENYFSNKKLNKKDHVEVDGSEFANETCFPIDPDIKSVAEFKRLREAAVQNFKNTGDVLHIIQLPGNDYSYFFDDTDRLLVSLSEDCELLIEFLEYQDKANDKIKFFEIMDERINQVINLMAYCEGREAYKYEQRELRSDCGKGQQEAQARRINELVNSLKNYDLNKGEIRITKNQFRGLVNKTFKGRENYPRHPNIYKNYQTEAEKKLKVKITFTT